MPHVHSTEFRGTPFNSRTAPLNVNMRWIAWDIYHVVEVFSDAATELRAIRNDAAVLDMSPLAKYNISGADAERFTNYVITRDASKIEIGQAYYTPWCDHEGKVVSDGIVFRVGEDAFRITGDPSHSWLMQHVDGFDVELDDVTHDYGILSLQGPKSRAVLETATADDWSGFPFSRVRMAKIGGMDVEVARQGFTGEHGYELCIAASDAGPMWDAIMDAGNDHGIRPAGFIAEDIARMEAGLVIPGPDYTKGGAEDERGSSIEVDAEFKSSPYELRMGRFVDLDKGEFLGRESLRRESEVGTETAMVGLLIDWSDLSELYIERGLSPIVASIPMWYPAVVIKDGARIGRATSITWSPAAESLAGFGFLQIDHCAPGTEVMVEVTVVDGFGSVNARVVELPFRELRRAKSSLRL